MSETATETTASVNGSGPATAPAGETGECTDCVSGGEKAVAVLGILFGVFMIVMAADMFSGGKISGMVRERQGE